MCGYSHLLNGVGRGAQDTALVIRATCDPDVAALAPAGSPRVLDQPVVVRVVLLVPHKQDPVVELLATAR